MKIAIDMDEVLADFVAQDLKLFNKTFEKNLTLANIQDQGGYTTTLYPEYEQQMKQLRDNAAFFENMRPIPDAIQIVQEIAASNEVFIVSAAMHFPNSISGKRAWLQKNLPFIHPYHYVFCGDKSIIAADYLIDDHLKNLKAFSGKGILFSAPHNEETSFPVRANNWLEVKQYFIKEGIL